MKVFRRKKSRLYWRGEIIIKNFTKKLILFIILINIGLLLTIIYVKNNSIYPSYTTFQLSEIRKNLLDLGITEKKSQKLIRKLKSGEIFDSLTMSYSDPNVTIQKVVDNNKIIFTYTFPDGSLIRVRSEVTNDIEIIYGDACSRFLGINNCPERFIYIEDGLTYSIHHVHLPTIAYGYSDDGRSRVIGNKNKAESMKIFSPKDNIDELKIEISQQFTITKVGKIDRKIIFYLGEKKMSKKKFI